MRNKKKPIKFRINEFYDGGVIRLDLNLPVPAKRVGYKKENGILIANVPSGFIDFENEVKEFFREAHDGWPMKGRLLMGISIRLPKSRYKTTDVDNMAKTIIDALRGIAYDDDKQIDSLFVSKSESQNCQVLVALKSLGQESRSWFIEPMLIPIPESKKTLAETLPD